MSLFILFYYKKNYIQNLIVGVNEIKASSDLLEETEMLSLSNAARSSFPTNDRVNYVKWNLDMNVTVSNLKKRCAQKTKYFMLRTCVVYTLLIALIIGMSIQWMKAEALQSQIDNVNINIRQLMHEYYSLDKKITHCELCEKISREFANWLKAKEIESTPEVLELIYRFSQIILPVMNQHYRSNIIEANDSDVLENVAMNLSSTSNSSQDNAIVDLDVKQNVVHIVRTLLSVETQNHTTRHVRHNTTNDERVLSEKEPRAERLRRRAGRGNRRRKSERKPKRNHRRLGPLLATFIGELPEQFITNKALVGPWVKKRSDDNLYDFTKFHLMSDKMSIEVTASGLYVISVQIFYIGNSTNCSYWLLLNSEGDSEIQKLAKCSSSSFDMTEVSCHTTIITYLKKADRLYVQQQEKYRMINMREGYSYIQFLMLSNNQEKH